MKRNLLLALPLSLSVALAAAPAPATTAPASAARYVTYAPDAFRADSGLRRVLFFHATWCPICKAADADFSAHLGQIPRNVVVFKTDYDREVTLKQTYGVTYQHTFVLVDAQGKALKKWNGGGLADLLSNLK